MIQYHDITDILADYDILPDHEPTFDYSDDSTEAGCTCQPDLTPKPWKLIFIIIGCSVTIVVQGKWILK